MILPRRSWKTKQFGRAESGCPLVLLNLAESGCPLVLRLGSWLNVAENELSSLTRQCVAGRRFGDIETLQAETTAWSTDVNKTQRGVDWQMKVNDARIKLKSVYPKIKM